MKDQIGLFENNRELDIKPLAYSSRPEVLKDFIGQHNIKKRLKAINLKNLPHIVFWGPPGTGKTTISAILAKEAGLNIYNFNAVLGGVNDLRALIKSSSELKRNSGQKSVIFIDEIHRFNKSQQDALLPYLESGEFILFGATTEYPQTSLNKAILSRVQTWEFTKLSNFDLVSILNKSIEKKSHNLPNSIKEDLINHISEYANGDARSALNSLEILLNSHNINELSFLEIKEELLNSQRAYDKSSDRHYDVISAFIKSLRGSDVDASILWLAVMIDGGEELEFIARRLVISASEDVGNADPRALTIASNCHYAIKHIGMPEARILLAQATTYIAQAPKSNSSYLAIDKALAFVKDNPTIEVPTHLRNQHPDKRTYK